jgi:hypothetical protein
VASSSKDGLCGRSGPKLTMDAAQDLSSAALVSMDFFQSSSVSVRSDVSDGCLSPTSQPLASVSALLVDSALTLVSMAYASKVIHHEATVSRVILIGILGLTQMRRKVLSGLREKITRGRVMKSFPRLKRRGTMQLLLCFCRVLGLSPRLWMGCLESLSPFLRRRVPLPS